MTPILAVTKRDWNGPPVAVVVIYSIFQHLAFPLIHRPQRDPLSFRHRHRHRIPPQRDHPSFQRLHFHRECPVHHQLLPRLQCLRCRPLQHQQDPLHRLPFRFGDHRQRLRLQHFQFGRALLFHRRYPLHNRHCLELLLVSYLEHLVNFVKTQIVAMCNAPRRVR